MVFCFLPVLLLLPICGASCGTIEQPAQLKNGSFVAELNGFRIHYEVHGTGPVLITLPNSWGINAATLRNLYKELEDSLTLVYFDPRGMGESDEIREERDMGLAAVRQDFDALRKHLGLGKVAVIGWSNGAMNLVYLASERPEALSRAIFLHGSASFAEEDSASLASKYPDLIEGYLTYQKQTQDETLSDDEKNELLREFWLSEMFPLICADPAAGKIFVPELFKDLVFSWRHADYSNRETSLFDERERLPMILVPSLIIHGSKDLITLEKAEELRDGMPDSKLVVLEGSGHFSPIEEPEAFREAVSDFLLKPVSSKH
jgi:pimeloyl-ACP methyl ester carboxylesterase